MKRSVKEPTRRIVIFLMNSMPKSDTSEGEEWEDMDPFSEEEEWEDMDQSSEEEDNAIIESQSPLMRNLLPRRVNTLQLNRRDNKINDMKDLVAVLKRKFHPPSDLIDILEFKFDEVSLDSVLKPQNNDKSTKTYTDDMKEFALIIYFYTPDAFDYLRTTMNFDMPQPLTIRNWISTSDCQPGFLNEVFEFLKTNAELYLYLQNVNLVYEETCLSAEDLFDWKTGKCLGYIDMGGGVKMGNYEELASDVLVFQIVALRCNFRCVIGYFFTKRLLTVTLTQLLKMAIVKLQEVNVQVRNVTFDGTSTGLTTLKELGCELPKKPYFTLEGVNHEITAMVDPHYMLKMCTFALLQKRIFQSPSGYVNMKYIEQLNKLTNEQRLKLADKLPGKNMFRENVKMDYNSPSTVLNSDVADAIEYLRKKKYPDFKNSEPTVEFIRKIVQLLEILNCGNPFGRDLKGPISLENWGSINDALSNIERYLLALKIDNVSILKDGRKIFVLGFLSDINAIRISARQLLKLKGFKYLLGHKFSKEHIELLISYILRQNGNHDPNVDQFSSILKKLMFKKRGTCLEFDPNIQNYLQSFSPIPKLDDKDEDLLTSSFLLNNSLNYHFRDNVIYSVSRFIVTRLEKKLSCEECCKALLTEGDGKLTFPSFSDFLQKGFPKKVSTDVLKIAKFMYKMLNYETRDKSKMNLIICKTCSYFKNSVFKNHKIGDCNEYDENNHVLCLIKMFGNLFLKVLCGNLETENARIRSFRPNSYLIQQLI